jgi:hypothetical protein
VPALPSAFPKVAVLQRDSHCVAMRTLWFANWGSAGRAGKKLALQGNPGRKATLIGLLIDDNEGH